MIIISTETSFRDFDGLYKKFNIQFLTMANTLSLLVINLDGYDSDSNGIDIKEFERFMLYAPFLQHIKNMFGLCININSHIIMIIYRGRIFSVNTNFKDGKLEEISKDKFNSIYYPYLK